MSAGIRPPLIVIAGPTASGKTGCAVDVCEAIGGEVVSADSMQLYRGMEILAATPTRSEMRGIAHHMLGIADPSFKWTAAAYREAAMPIISDILKRGRWPVICGGTGLYINALTRPMSFAKEGNSEIRRELENIAADEGGREKLHEILKKVDPESAAKLNLNDVRRVIRAIEVFRLTGVTQPELARRDAMRDGSFDEVMFAIDWPRDELYSRIDRRVDLMFENGLVDQVKALMSDETEHPTAIQAIGYKETASALRGEITMDEAIEAIKLNTRHYAKRQLTWFRRDARVQWIRASEHTADEIVEKVKRKYPEEFTMGEICYDGFIYAGHKRRYY